MVTTIKISFDPSILPAWARRYPAVVEAARRDLGFRCDVCSLRSPAWRNVLRTTAATIVHQSNTADETIESCTRAPGFKP
jgi:hypothetical protein